MLLLREENDEFFWRVIWNVNDFDLGHDVSYYHTEIEINLSYLKKADCWLSLVYLDMKFRRKVSHSVAGWPCTILNVISFWLYCSLFFYLKDIDIFFIGSSLLLLYWFFSVGKTGRTRLHPVGQSQRRERDRPSRRQIAFQEVKKFAPEIVPVPRVLFASFDFPLWVFFVSLYPFPHIGFSTSSFFAAYFVLGKSDLVIRLFRSSISDSVSMFSLPLSILPFSPFIIAISKGALGECSCLDNYTLGLNVVTRFFPYFKGFYRDTYLWKVKWNMVWGSWSDIYKDRWRFHEFYCFFSCYDVVRLTSSTNSALSCFYGVIHWSMKGDSVDTIHWV